jgi:thiamine-phosphate pyrophosphorylase
LLPRVYAILDVDTVATRGLAPLEVADVWLDAGVRLIQLRAKSLSSGPFQALADALVARAHQAGARLIVNDRADIAALAGADGVHVGQDDLSPAQVRPIVGSGAIVGVSTHTDSQIADAVAPPVSYVAIGPVFGTRTKETGYEAVGVDQVRRAAAAARAADLPLVAIGGITRLNAASVLETGADSVAVISDLLDDSLAGCAALAGAWVNLIERT